MKPIDFDALYVIQEVYQSTATLSIMTDSTSRSFDEMHSWRYTDKDEMKRLGATLFQMSDKFIELMILGISKMVEDFFNNLADLKKSEIKIWDTTFDGCRFSSETRRVRHLGNVIKHNNSVVDSTKGKSAAALVAQFGMDDGTPIRWQKIFRGAIDDVIFQTIYMAHEFCMDVMVLYSIPLAHKTNVPVSGMKEEILARYVHTVPGHPKYEK